MKKVNVSTKKIDQFAGKWVAIDTIKDRIIAVGNELKDIGPLISRSTSDKRSSETMPAAFKVPSKDEGPYYILTIIHE